ncbi:MAG TPA: hypothetical protein VGL20_03545 [Candidatus Dormibacteraeota bacterium]|jgi:hypothetical protein
MNRLVTTTAPLALAGVLQLALGAGSASAATLPSAISAPLSAVPLVASTGGPLSLVTGLLVHPATPAAASSATAAGAPSGRAVANGANLGIIDSCISCTNAVAGSGSSQAGAQALRLLGQDLSAGQASSNGAQSGALLTLPANPLLALALADWMTAAQASGLSSSSHSRSALADLALGNGQVATVAVLEATSNALFSPSASHGDAANNGVDATLLNGGLAIIVLHSDTSSDGTGTTYVASINGQQLLASHDGGIPISLPGVGTINLLQVGAAGGVAASAIGTVDNLLGAPGQAAGVLTSSSAGAAAATSTPTVPAAGAPKTGVVAGPTSADVQPSTPFTGISLGLGGFALLAGGLGLLATLARRRTSAA